MNSMVCVQICAEEEWRAVRGLLKVPQEEIDHYPYGEFFIHYGETEPCRFFCSGDTKTKAAAACQYAIDHWHPEFLLVLGTCGGVTDGLRPLDVVIADRTAIYDCIIRMAGECRFFYPSLDVTLDNSWIDFSGFGERVHRGLIASADQDIDHKTRQVLLEHGVLAADWESGSISYVCQVNKIPCCLVRCVSDIPTGDDHGQGKEYKTNTPSVMEKLIRRILPVLLRQLGIKTTAGRYTSVTSPYVRKEMAGTSWKDRKRIDALIRLRNYIVEPPRGYAAGMGFGMTRDQYKEEYLDLLREHSEEAYEKEVARREEERRKRAELRERSEQEE